MKEIRDLRILVVGFSVTAAPFGRKLRNELLKIDGVSHVDVVSMGGNHPQGMMYFFDEIGKATKYDIVIFELNTSGFRKHGRGVKSVVPFMVLAAKARARGMEPIFLNLPRADVDPFDDEVRRLTGVFYASAGIACFDLDAAAYAEFGAPLLHTEFFKDDGYGAHPIDVYENWLVERSIERIAEFTDRFTGPGAVDVDLAEAYRVIPLSELCPGRSLHPFSRGGFEFPHIEIAGGETVVIDGIDLTLCGISYLSWPQAGAALVEAGSHSIKLQCLDPWSYYERLQHLLFEPVRVSRISIKQYEEIPNITLKKGETSQAPRIGRFGMLLVAAASPAEVLASINAKYFASSEGAEPSPTS